MPTWGDLFDRASEYETSVETITARLSELREARAESGREGDRRGRDR